MASNNPGGKVDQDLEDYWRLTAQRARDCACFFDFDGTLANIKDDPEDVQLVPGALEALAKLVEKVRKVVIVSARPAHFLHRHFKHLPGIAIFGLYGLESLIDSGPIHTHPESAPFEVIMANLAEIARAELPHGVLVEYKRLSLALHYRTVPELGTCVEQWAICRAHELGLHTQPGRMVIELKPPGDRDKGIVVSENIKGLSCAWYFGDDLSDIRGFTALEDRMEIDQSFVGIRVCVANEENGETLRHSADICIDSPERVPEFLNSLTNAISLNCVNNYLKQ